MADVDLDHRLRKIQSEYMDILDDQNEDGFYGIVKEMIDDNKIRVVVNLNDLRMKSSVRAKGLLANSFEEVTAFQKALHEFVGTINPNYAAEHEEFFISFEGCFGNKHVTPRTLQARLLGNMVCVEGIVTKCSLVCPKVVRSVHFCPATGKTLERRYTDLTSIDAFPSSSVYPIKDEDGNLLETEYGWSTYKNHQTLAVQEMPEKAPAGQLPRSVDVICDNDLADKCSPGDRVQIVGNYRCLPSKKGNVTSGIFRTVVLANNVETYTGTTVEITREDVTRSKALARRHKDVFEILSHSLAPSIHGNEYVKKAILCMLLGGVEKVLPNGTRLRGDINILLIGDPSVAKSQLLRYVLRTAPRAIATTGRGSSGVGLTAAVTTDQETGERRLEAGAMVLADRGVVCIDEFDKMSDIDRTAIHEVMEQGRVTISKAGIHARLNARCSVLAAANPIYGKYDQYKTPMENIALQDSLLSRFDLLFVMLDVVDSECDKRISQHVVRMHRYRNPGEQDGQVLTTIGTADMLITHGQGEEEKEETGKPVPMYEKYDSLLHGASRNKRDKILTMAYLQKYIHIAKVLKPVLTEEASEMISEEYSKLRSQDLMESQTARTQPVTARTLETMIRLSTAHAKGRLSKRVEAQDAEAAIELVQYAYFKKVLEKPKKNKRHSEDVNESGSETENEDDGLNKEGSHVAKKRKENGDVYDFYEDLGEVSGTSATLMDTQEAAPTSVTPERLKAFKNMIVTVFRESRTQSMALAKFLAAINSQLTDEDRFDDGEAMAAIHVMVEENQLFLSDGIIILV